MTHFSITAELNAKKRYRWLAMALFSSLLAMLGLRSLTLEQEDVDSGDAARPNILMIVADDLGYNDISSLNSAGIETPTIDQLAKNGVLFTRFYADSICAPSRVALLTGREPERSGFRPGGMGIPQEFTTLPELLGSHGYTTKLVGKWHAGTAHRRSWPDQQGFQQWFGFLDQWQLQLPANSQRSGAKPNYNNPWLQRDSQPPEQHTGHLTDILLEESVRFIRQNKDSNDPWFLYHAFLAPHHPIQPEQRFARQFPDTPEGQYRALVTQMDNAVGELIRELETSGDLTNTVIIFLSDNGGTNRQLDNNYPFKGSKAQVFEGSYRTPLLIHWPAQLKPQLLRDIVHNTDIYPSLASALGLAPTATLDGRNLWPQWLAANAHGEERSQQANTGKLRFWETYYPGLELMSFSALSHDGRWRLSHDLQRTVTLYDLHSDPSGYTDVAHAHPDIVESMGRQYLSASTKLAQLPLASEMKEHRLLSGFDQMRLADDHQQTVVFELWSPGDADYPQDLLMQPGDWIATVDEDRRVHLSAGEYDISSTEPLPNTCVVVSLTTNYSRAAYIGPKEQQTVLKLYSSGLLQGTITLPTARAKRQQWPPTEVTSSRVGEIRFFNKLAFGIGETPPVNQTPSDTPRSTAIKLSQLFYQPSIEELSQGLCPNEVL